MSKNEQNIVTVGFVSLGCPKNLVDSERMLAEIVQAGFLISADPDDADVVVINTCGFIEPARQEALAAINKAAECKSKGRVLKIVVAGCLAERQGPELIAEAPEIDAVVGLGQRDHIAEIIKQTLGADGPAAYIDSASCHIADDRTRLIITPPHLAYLRISEGCDHRCSFCTIPSIRGRFRSKPKDLIMEEANELVSAGTVELNVIAQDTAYWGKDLKIKEGLADLIADIETIEGLQWLRLLYLYPVGITDKLLKTVAESEKILPYFDIPMQHINNKILKDMRRPDSSENIHKLLERIRSVIPEAVLRTTLIVGFPGETDEQFAELLEFIKWARFDALGCFPYYPETGTDAAKMAGQIADEVKQQRVEEVMLTQQEIAFEKNAERVDSELVCLVDSVGKNKTATGRYYGQAPDVDSVCIIKRCKAEPGDFVRVQVTSTRDYDLICKQI